MNRKRTAAKVFLTFAAPFFLTLAGCGEDLSDPLSGRLPLQVHSEPFEEVEAGTFSYIKNERLEVIRDPETWEAFWLCHIGHPDCLTNNGLPAIEPPGGWPPPPVIDFGEDMVIAVFLGKRPSSGFSVGITGVFNLPDRVHISYEEIVPGNTCFVATVLTNPYQIVKTNRIDKEAFFSRIEVPYHCE